MPAMPNIEQSSASQRNNAMCQSEISLVRFETIAKCGNNSDATKV